MKYHYIYFRKDTAKKINLFRHGKTFFIIRKHILYFSLLIFLIVSGCHKVNKDQIVRKIIIEPKMIKSRILIRKKIAGKYLRPLQLLKGINGEILFIYEYEKFSTRIDIFDKNLKLIKKGVKLDFKSKYPSDFFYTRLVPYNKGYIVFDWKRKVIIYFSSDFKTYYKSFSLKNFTKMTNIYPANNDNIILTNNTGTITNGKFRNRYDYLLFNLKTLKTKLLFKGYVYPVPIKDDSYYFLKEDFLSCKTDFIIIDRNNDIIGKYDYQGNLKKRVKIGPSRKRITEEDKKKVIEERIKFLELIMKRKFSYYKMKKRIKFREYFPVYSFIYNYGKGFMAVKVNDLKNNYKGSLTVDIFSADLNYRWSFSIPRFYNYGNIRLVGGRNEFFLYSEINDSFYLLGSENLEENNEKIIMYKIGNKMIE